MRELMAALSWRVLATLVLGLVTAAVLLIVAGILAFKRGASELDDYR